VKAALLQIRQQLVLCARARRALRHDVLLIALEFDAPWPRNMVAARFSVPFAVATTLVTGVGMRMTTLWPFVFGLHREGKRDAEFFRIRSRTCI